MEGSLGRHPDAIPGANARRVSTSGVAPCRDGDSRLGELHEGHGFREEADSYALWEASAGRWLDSWRHRTSTRWADASGDGRRGERETGAGGKQTFQAALYSWIRTVCSVHGRTTKGPGHSPRVFLKTANLAEMRNSACFTAHERMNEALDPSFRPGLESPNYTRNE
jgi:hypothetical protein